LCKRIAFPLKYSIRNSSTLSSLRTYTAVIDITIVQNNDSLLEPDYLRNYASLEGYKFFTFLPEDAVTKAQYTLFNDDTIRVSLKIAETYSNTRLKLKILRNEAKITPQIQLEAEIKEEEIWIPASF
jgi:hypothetical protein